MQITSQVTRTYTMELNEQELRSLHEILGYVQRSGLPGGMSANEAVLLRSMLHTYDALVNSIDRK